MRRIDVNAGERFGRLVVIDEADQGPRGRRRFRLKCDCGTVMITSLDGLRSGKTNSCGCYREQRRVESHTIHGQTKNGAWTAEYRAWRKMLERCYDPNNNRFVTHGARGITVCAEWRVSFDNFIAAVGPRPSQKHSLDRFPDNDGPYAPGNVRWATAQQQAQNRRNAVLLTVGNRTANLAVWARELGITPDAITRRIALGWSVERAVTTPCGGGRSA